MKAQAIRYLIDQVVPDSVMCPISQALMHHPVTLPGDPQHVFERASAVAWLGKQRTNPFTRAEVPSGPVVAQPERKKHIAQFIRETGRFHRSFGTPREAAARTIQAAWLQYTADRPAWKSTMAALRGQFEQAQKTANGVDGALASVGTVVTRGHGNAQGDGNRAYRMPQRFQDVATRVDWDALDAMHGDWSIHLRNVLEQPSIAAMTALHTACAAAGHDFASLVLAQNAAPLRALLHVDSLPILAACAYWVPAGTYGTLRMPGRMARLNPAYVGEVNGDGKRHGLGLRTNGYTVEYGHWQNDAFSGYGVRRVQDLAVYTGEFSNGTPRQVSVRRIYGRKGDNSPEQIECCTSREGETLGRIQFTNGDVYRGACTSNGVIHGHGELTNSDGERTLGQWHDGRMVGVALNIRAWGVTLEALDSAGQATLQEATEGRSPFVAEYPFAAPL